jgi:hypothetical protein
MGARPSAHSSLPPENDSLHHTWEVAMLHTRSARPAFRALLVLIPVILLLGSLATSVFSVPAAPGAVCGGTIFRDYDASGSRGPREPGIAGVTATAYDTNNVAIASDVSDAAGAYALTITDGLNVRIEFTTIPGGFFSGPFGANSPTSVTFVNTANCNRDFGVNLPTQYCQTDPQMATNCYTFGDQSTVTNPVLISFPYSAGGTVLPAIDQPLTHTVLATASQVGSTWGLAYQRASNSLFAAAFMKRHSGFGPGSTGAIYRVDRNTGAVSTFINLNALFPGSTGADPHGVNGYTRDSNSWDAVGKLSLGDIDISTDEQTLYAVNLFDRQLYQIPIGVPPVAPPAGSIGRFPIPLPGDCIAAVTNSRPFGLTSHDGLVYVGQVCSAETTQNPADLRAYVYSFNPATSAFAQVLNFPLNYPRGCAVVNGPPATCTGAEWRPWVNVFSVISTTFSPPPNGEFVYPQPWLTDIEFDNDDMLIGLRDRYGDQMGYRKLSTTPPNATLYTGDAAGDVLRACWNGAAWILESNATCGSITTAGANTGQGPGTGAADPVGYGEYFFGENYPNHDETSLAGLAQVPGRAEFVETVYDPIFDVTNFFDGGTLWSNHNDGSRAKTHRIFSTDTTDPLTFGKAGGLGDLEALCNLPPIEIGNRVWRDRTDLTRDGLQGATDNPAQEFPIQGVTVHLYRAGTLIATDVTDANGEYIFNAANVPGGILPDTAYQIRLDNATDYTTGPLTGLILTLANQGGAANNDIDSDGAYVTGFPEITAVTRNYGDNDHTFDFGFHNIPTAVELLYFRIDGVNDRQVDVAWATAAEIDNFGFNLYRAPVDDFARAELIHFEPSTIRGSGPGATYSYVDSVADDGLWWYWLADVDTQGRETLHGSALAVVGADALPFRFYLPIILEGLP